MNKKAITSKSLDELIDNAIYREAEEDNLEIGKALKDISESRLKEILGIREKKRRFNKKIWERVAWSVSVAALIAVAISVPIAVENNAKNKICDVVYAYNAPELNDMLWRTSRSSADQMPNITLLSDASLQRVLPHMATLFYKAESLQDIALEGRILALAYIRLHRRDDAIRVLEVMIEKLSGDEDYGPTVKECQELLLQIK